MVSRRPPRSISAGSATSSPQPQSAMGSSARRAKSTTGKVARNNTQGALRTKISAEERQAMIREAAYLRAERRGFGGGSEVSDWLAAEREVDELLGANITNSAQ